MSPPAAGTPGWSPGGATRLAAVIGDPVRHSLSPTLFNAAYRALGLDRVFVAFEVAPGHAPAALEAMRTLGIDAYSVTMPHKEAVAAAVDRLSEDARALSAVNCVLRDRDVLTGHNTDGPGFVRALVDETGLAPSGAHCVVVGAGGAARAVVLALARAGAAEVVVVNRTPARGETAAALAGAIGRLGDADDVANADLVIDATPAGMPGHPPLAFDPDRLGPRAVVVDLVYHPATTPLLAAARDRGLVAVNGLGMLVHQAAVQFELATGSPAPIAVMASAARLALENVNSGWSRADG